MKSRLGHLLILLVAVLGSAIVASTFNPHVAHGAAPLAYKVDVVRITENYQVPIERRTQVLLDQRASEGWSLVSVAGVPEEMTQHGDPVRLGMVLVFKRSQ